MKFLVDAQLPRRLAAQLVARGHDALHTLDLPDRNRTTDGAICAIALREERIVISKDSDFAQSYALDGRPHRLLLIATGNIANRDLLVLLGQSLAAIELAFATARFVEVNRRALVVHD